MEPEVTANKDASPQTSRGWIVPTILFAAVGIAAIFLPVAEWLESFRLRVDQLGWAGPIAFILLFALLTVCLVPGAAMTIAAGSLFGLWRGTLYVMIGSNVGTIAAFLLARTVLRQRVEVWVRDNPRFGAIDSALGENGFKVVMLLRLSPLFPFCVLNYVLGLTRVTLARYAAGGVLGMLPGTVLFVYIGTLSENIGQASAHEPPEVWRLKLALKIVGLLATIAVTWWITRIANAALTSSTSSNPSLEK